jgi:hypothetical protein
MKRTAGVWLLVAVLEGGGTAMPTNAQGWGGAGWGPTAPPASACKGSCLTGASDLVGPWGQPVPVQAPATPGWTTGFTRRSILDSSLPLNTATGMPSGVVQAGGKMTPGTAPITLVNGTCPPGGCPGGGAVMTLAPGAPIGPVAPGGPIPPGGVAAVGALTGPGAPARFCTQRTSVRFASPTGMTVSWYSMDGRPGFDANQLKVPGRYNFSEGAIYRLKLSNIPGRPPTEVLYPTLEVVPACVKTATFLAHSSVPVAFTADDFEQVAAGAYVVKVIYLPDPPFQDLAPVGPSEIISTRLEPGADPIAEALRRGSILLVVRMGNIDLEAANTPAMDAPNPYLCNGMVPPGAGLGSLTAGPGMLPPGVAGSKGQPVMAPTGPMAPPPPVPTAPAKTPVPTGVPSAMATPPANVQQAQYAAPVNFPPSPAALASQMPGGTSAVGDAKAAPKRHWWSLFDKSSDK